MDFLTSDLEGVVLLNWTILQIKSHLFIHSRMSMGANLIVL